MPHSSNAECMCRLQEAFLQPLLGAVRAQACAVPDVPALRRHSFRAKSADGSKGEGAARLPTPARCPHSHVP